MYAHELTLVRRHRADLGHLLLAGGMAGKATHLAHHPLAGEAHHEGGAVGALDGVAEGAHKELVSLLLHHVRRRPPATAAAAPREAQGRGVLLVGHGGQHSRRHVGGSLRQGWQGAALHVGGAQLLLLESLISCQNFYNEN